MNMPRHNPDLPPAFKRAILFMCCVGLFSVSNFDAALAQGVSHSDVFFTFGDSKIQVEPQDGRLVIPQTMPTSGFFAQANSNPGFFSERDLGGGTQPNDVVGYNVLDNLILWNDGEFIPPNPDTAIRILNNPGTVEDTLIGAASDGTADSEQLANFDPPGNSIGQSGSSGEFHAHVDFRLEPLSADPDETPLFGAYGIKLSLATDNVDIEDSDPFFVVFQFGIDDDQFGDALDAFDSLLGSQTLLGDFDADGVLSPVDIDLLSAAVTAGNNEVSFDLTDDRRVNQLDRVQWVEQLAGTFFGDVDLDRNVQFEDFLALAQSFGGPGGWADGDFDGDGRVLFSDFLSLADNFGQRNDGLAATSVPEPTNVSWFALFAALVVFRSVGER